MSKAISQTRGTLRKRNCHCGVPRHQHLEASGLFYAAAATFGYLLLFLPTLLPRQLQLFPENAYDSTLAFDQEFDWVQNCSFKIKVGRQKAGREVKNNKHSKPSVS